MGTEANKSVIKRYFRALGEGRLAEFDTLVSSDVDWWLVGTGKVDVQVIKDASSQMFSSPPGPDAMEIISMTAEDDRVSVELVSHLKLPDDRDYNNHYHMLFTVRDGQISKVREYLDTAYTEKLFGRPARWPATKSA